MGNLNDVIVRAKAACYVGGGVKTEPSRPGSHDLTWSDGDWEYRDSYLWRYEFHRPRGSLVQANAVLGDELLRLHLSSKSDRWRASRSHHHESSLHDVSERSVPRWFRVDGVSTEHTSIGARAMLAIFTVAR
ncbi:hypothetical protein QE369_004674 [Agrobacterium larrymoorei]|uniref:Uncharacterized protein n=1 Tax=Agrobacterium larrymoorei TaxID=160699 RepID=A0AAJ2BGD0_9HYPH|nr:hypothetical protein [Agrobacterium larrymoorei]